MNINPNSPIGKALTEMGFVFAEDFEGQTYTLKNKDKFEILLVPTEQDFGNSVITVEWNIEKSTGSQGFENTNPITVLAETYEYFSDISETENGDLVEIKDILEETLSKIALNSCN